MVIVRREARYFNARQMTGTCAHEPRYSGLLTASADSVTFIEETEHPISIIETAILIASL